MRRNKTLVTAPPLNIVPAGSVVPVGRPRPAARAPASPAPPAAMTEFYFPRGSAFFPQDFSVPPVTKYLCVCVGCKKKQRQKSIDMYITFSLFVNE